MHLISANFSGVFAWNYETILGMRCGQSEGKQIIRKLTLIAVRAEQLENNPQKPIWYCEKTTHIFYRFHSETGRRTFGFQG